MTRPATRPVAGGTVRLLAVPENAPKGRIRRRQERAILAAAERVFARAGYEGATMAEIAAEAGLPKANLHYYFGTKAEVYRAVLSHILRLWLAETDCLTPEADPRTALTRYVSAKMRLTATHASASRVFANELLHGAGEIGDFLRTELRALVAAKAAVIEDWIAAGRMAPVDPIHLFFTIWAITQTYADFETQVCAVLDRSQLDQDDYARATDHVLGVVLRTCGLADPHERTAGPPHA